jgi:hypothetical protein
MTENSEDTGTAREDTGTAREDDGPGRGEDEAAHGSPSGDLSSKLDPDFIPQQGDTPEVERTREHPEETGS